MSDARHIADVVDGCAALAAAGLGDMVWGHPSVRDGEGRGIWMKSSGYGFDEIIPDRVVLVSWSGEVLRGDGRRHIEYPIHTRPYLARADVNAVVHTQIHLDVPATSRVWLEGSFAEGVDSRDLLHHLIAAYGADGFVGQVIEYDGPGAAAMSLGHRQSLCGMAMFTGAVSSIFNPDDRALAYTRSVTERPFVPLRSDPDASYVRDVVVRLDALEPQVVDPGSARAANTRPVGEATGTPVERAFIGSCVSGRIEDLRAASRMLAGRRVADGVALHVVPTSNAIRAQAESEGLLDVLEQAGAQIHRSSCDFCFGYAHPLRPGERCISTGVLNVSGRMGSTEAQIYMGSAYTVAASALTGRITDPRELLGDAPGSA